MMYHLNGFAYLTSEPVLFTLSACALPILVHYQIPAHCAHWYATRFNRYEPQQRERLRLLWHWFLKSHLR